MQEDKGYLVPEKVKSEKKLRPYYTDLIKLDRLIVNFRQYKRDGKLITFANDYDAQEICNIINKYPKYTFCLCCRKDGNYVCYYIRGTEEDSDFVGHKLSMDHYINPCYMTMGNFSTPINVKKFTKELEVLLFLVKFAPKHKKSGSDKPLLEWVHEYNQDINVKMRKKIKKYNSYRWSNWV